MIEQMKNPNEYREDGKLYIKKIKRCRCMRKDDDIYTIDCNIKQRGYYAYTYHAGDDHIDKWGSDKKLWLSADAKVTIDAEINFFEAFVETAKGVGFDEFECQDTALSLFYRYSKERYDFVIRYQNARTGQSTTEVIRDVSTDDFLDHLRYRSDICKSKIKQILEKPDKDSISEHPLIIAARKYGDIKLEIEIKLYYHLATSEDCAQLSEMLGVRILPPLPVEFSKKYVIDTDTMTGQSHSLLMRSGYVILHQPAFAMMGQLRKRLALNPHTKYGVDAARADSEAISFDDFLKLFDDCDENRSEEEIR